MGILLLVGLDTMRNEALEGRDVKERTFLQVQQGAYQEDLTACARLKLGVQQWVLPPGRPSRAEPRSRQQ